MLTTIKKGGGGGILCSFSGISNRDLAYLNAAAGTHFAVFHMKTRTGFGYL